MLFRSLIWVRLPPRTVHTFSTFNAISLAHSPSAASSAAHSFLSPESMPARSGHDLCFGGCGVVCCLCMAMTDRHFDFPPPTRHGHDGSACFSAQGQASQLQLSLQPSSAAIQSVPNPGAGALCDCRSAAAGCCQDAPAKLRGDLVVRPSPAHTRRVRCCDLKAGQRGLTDQHPDDRVSLVLDPEV